MIGDGESRQRGDFLPIHPIHRFIRTIAHRRKVVAGKCHRLGCKTSECLADPGKPNPPVSLPSTQTLPRVGPFSPFQEV